MAAPELLLSDRFPGLFTVVVCDTFKLPRFNGADLHSVPHNGPASPFECDMHGQCN